MMRCSTRRSASGSMGRAARVAAKRSCRSRMDASARRRPSRLASSRSRWRAANAFFFASSTAGWARTRSIASPKYSSGDRCSTRLVSRSVRADQRVPSRFAACRAASVHVFEAAHDERGEELVFRAELPVDACHAGPGCSSDRGHGRVEPFTGEYLGGRHQQALLLLRLVEARPGRDSCSDRNGHSARVTR